MANNSISWVGNRIMDQSSLRQPSRTAASDLSATNYAAPPTSSMQNDSTTSMLPPMQQGPPPVSDKGYIPYYLASNIGKNVRAEFILGNSQYVDKTGKLVEVGINYFVLQDVNSGTNIMCDLYSVKFVTILLNDADCRMFSNN